MDGDASPRRPGPSGTRTAAVSDTWPQLWHEHERRQVLQALEATQHQDERFDRITRMATRYLAVPIALVSLIDDERQRFRSVIGLDRTDVPRDVSVCAHTLDAGDVLVVPDLGADERFRSFPVVAGPTGARSYVGLPLVVAGHRVGTLCVMDTRPRSFDEDERAALIDLAAWAESELLGEQSREVVRQLDELRRRYAMVLDGVAEGVVGLDAAGVVTFVNGAAEQLLGWPHGDLVGRAMHPTLHARHADGSPYPAHECPVSATLRTGTEQRLLQEVFWRRDGSPFPADWSVGAVDDGDDVVGAVVVFEDVTRRVELDRIKDGFVSVVSHELRTPLTSLRGALELLTGGLLGEHAGPDAERLVTIAHTNAERLARLVDDILDLERSSRGDMPLARGPIDVARLLADAAGTVHGTATHAGVTVQVDPGAGTLWGDEHRLLQVLSNLLGNAIRFSPEGSTVRLAAGTGTWGVRIGVADDGVGIAPEAQERVFERFWQVDASDTRARSGTGLGLAIAKNIVEAHGGAIALDSAVGRGSTFTVSLPQRRLPGSSPPDDETAMAQLDVPTDRRSAT